MDTYEEVYALGAQKNSIKRYRLSVWIAFGVFIALYVPLVIIMCTKFDVIGRSMSWNAAKYGAKYYMFGYVLIAVPLAFFQLVLFMRMSSVKIGAALPLMCVGGVAMIFGVLSPLNPDKPTWWTFFHSLGCQAGSLLMILAVSYLVYLYCVQYNRRLKLIATSYIALILLAAVGFYLYFTATLYELGATFVFVLVVFIVNFAMLYNLRRAGALPREKRRVKMNKPAIALWCAAAVLAAVILIWTTYINVTVNILPQYI